MKHIIPAIALSALAAACGGSSPTPTTPTPTPIPAANVVASGTGTWASCTSLGCRWSGAIQNTGPGCANSVTGVVQFKNAAGQAVGSTYQLLILGQSSGVIRPNEIVQAQSLTTVDSATVNQVATYTVTPSWTNVACQ